ncbi:hypothetical protein B597_001845 [Stutzerimonas stutzeri KOS6]|uniref:Uncharacterized protein n=1 Tax=Stutzerimonas stutzeri KOS6 TaxID=1218352 RepID=A0A061JWQ9_STUST|nr:hypothetical protein B597_001845 [Stutzerimonas stutzeri KOS6]
MKIYGNETTVTRLVGTLFSYLCGATLASFGPDLFPALGGFAAWPGIVLGGAGIIYCLPPEPPQPGEKGSE